MMHILGCWNNTEPIWRLNFFVLISKKLPVRFHLYSTRSALKKLLVKQMNDSYKFQVEQKLLKHTVSLICRAFLSYTVLIELECPRRVICDNLHRVQSFQIFSLVFTCLLSSFPNSGIETTLLKKARSIQFYTWKNVY